MKYDDNQVFEYLDGGMSQAEVSAFRQALDTDSELAGRLDEAQAARALWRNAAHVAEPSAEDWVRIDRAVMQTVMGDEHDVVEVWSSGSGAATTLRWMAMAAAIALAAYGGYRALQNADEASTTDLPSEVVAQSTALEVGKAGAIIAAGSQPKQARVSKATLILAPAAACKVVRASKKDTRIDLISGAVTFDVGKRAPGATFKVRAGRVNVTVVGTRFTVTMQNDGTVGVDVAEGVVKVQRNREAASMLKAGDSIRMAPAQVAETAATEDDEASAEEEPGEVAVAEDEPAADEVEVAKADPVRVAKVVRKPRVGHRRAARTKPAVEKPAKDEVEKPAKDEIGPIAAFDPSKAPAPAVDLDDESLEENSATDKSAGGVVVEVGRPGSTELEKQKLADEGGADLEVIVKRIGVDAYANSIQKLIQWRSQYRFSRHRSASTYALGYCEFKRGNRSKANRLFKRLPKNNRWLKKVGDFSDPPKP